VEHQDVRLEGRQLLKGRVIEIVKYIVEQVAEQPELAESEDNIRDFLLDKGYPPNEINAALHLISMPASSDARTQPRRHSGKRPVRVLMPWERAKLSAEAQSILTKLDLMQLITEEEREAIIDRACYSDGQVGKDDMNLLVMLCALPGKTWELQRMVLETLNGGESKVVH